MINGIKGKICLLPLLMLSSMLVGQTVDSTARFSIHGQTTFIEQYKLAFKAPYTGNNSLLPSYESQESVTSTLFAGCRLWKNASIWCNPEMAGGSGISKALGIAAATNGETFRVGNPSPQLYIARLFIQHTFAFSGGRIIQADDINQLKGYIPLRYLSLVVGKIGMADYFDRNSYSHDPRTQFMCWGLMSNGAWDYPANVRGYTPSVIVTYGSPKSEYKAAISLVPITANGSKMNWDIGKARSLTAEYTGRYSILGRSGAIRLLGFYTVANMGNYNLSILANPLSPDITSVRKDGGTKYGFAINAEQALNDHSGVFIRASWNDGHYETWAFTEIDRSLSAGYSTAGDWWHRTNDRLGLAWVVSGLSVPHRNYLAYGGSGFMLGDGNLRYALEQVGELYYSFSMRDGIQFSGAYQMVLNPGYNADRHGPVNVFSVRVHLAL